MNLLIAPLLLACVPDGPSVQDESAYKKLALGDRVEITLLNGATLTGRLVPSPLGTPEGKIESIDYTREKALTIDVGTEYPGVTGSMTVLKNQLKGVRKVQNLDKKTLEEVERQKALLKKQQEAERARPKPTVPAPETSKPEPPRKPAADAEADRKKEEDLKKGRELFAKYAPPAWGPDRHTAIRLKILRGQTPTPAEREFTDGFSLWELGRRAEEGKPAPTRKP